MRFPLAEIPTSGLLPWPPTTLWEAILAVVIFGLIGIGLAVLGFKVFDWVTPGDLDEEVIRKNNLSAAIVTAAFILGVCLIIARVVGG